MNVPLECDKANVKATIEECFQLIGDKQATVYDMLIEALSYLECSIEEQPKVKMRLAIIALLALLIREGLLKD